jgi:hypothetical protein
MKTCRYNNKTVVWIFDERPSFGGYLLCSIAAAANTKAAKIADDTATPKKHLRSSCRD